MGGKTFGGGALALAISISWGCAAAPGLDATRRPSPDVQLKLAAANAQAARGCYVGFKNALRLYADLYARPASRTLVASSYLRTILLLMIREREVGMLDPGQYRTAAAVLGENRSLRAYQPLFDIADSLPARSQGIMQDINPVAVKRVVDEVRSAARSDLRTKALVDDYYDYVYLSFFTAYGMFPTSDAELVKDLLQRFPQSILLRYKRAIQPRLDGEALRGLLAEEPEFFEAEYNLGELALAGQDLLEAERRLLKAYDGIPESPQVTVHLGAIYLATEEYDKSLEFYDTTIALSPEFRDALLGKGICLSSMGRYEDALKPLARIVELGYYMLGESHYWLAWNYHALKNEVQAEVEIEESKPRLPTNSEAYALSGTIAQDLGKTDKAEKEFTESLRYNPANTEALFGLGNVNALKARWKESGGFYENAAGRLESNEAALLAKIDEIRNSALSEGRKAKLVARKEQQLAITKVTAALAFYNAAASYANLSGPEIKAKAADLAARAATHPQLKERAEALLKKLRSKLH